MSRLEPDDVSGGMLAASHAEGFGSSPIRFHSRRLDQEVLRLRDTQVLAASFFCEAGQKSLIAAGELLAMFGAVRADV